MLFPGLRAACLLAGLALVPLPRGPAGAQDAGALLPEELRALFARAEDVSGKGLAFVELGSARDTYLPGETFALQLRFGFERELLTAGLVRLFQRPLDVPAQVFAPALELLEGAQFLAAAEPETGASFALGERIVRATPAADEQRAGRTYAVFEYERRAVGLRPGVLELAAPLLGFARATRFQDDFVLGKVPLDRSDALVRGAAARLTILPLPEEGRPPEFTGAIGRFTLHATAEPRELELGASLKLTLVVEGEGDLSRCEPPLVHDLFGFHLQGSLVERGPARLAVVHDLAPLGEEVRAVPPIRFAFFDTTPPAGYRTLESQPIPIVVRPPARREPVLEPSATSSGPLSRAPWWLAPLGVGGLALAALWSWRVRRQRRSAE